MESNSAIGNKHACTIGYATLSSKIPFTSDKTPFSLNDANPFQFLGLVLPGGQIVWVREKEPNSQRKKNN